MIVISFLYINNYLHDFIISIAIIHSMTTSINKSHSPTSDRGPDISNFIFDNNYPLHDNCYLTDSRSWNSIKGFMMLGIRKYYCR